MLSAAKRIDRDYVTPMANYRRSTTRGASWFFTVNLAQRHGTPLLLEQMDALRDAVSLVRNRPETRSRATRWMRFATLYASYALAHGRALQTD